MSEARIWKASSNICETNRTTGASPASASASLAAPVLSETKSPNRLSNSLTAFSTSP